MARRAPGAPSLPAGLAGSVPERNSTASCLASSTAKFAPYLPVAARTGSLITGSDSTASSRTTFNLAKACAPVLLKRNAMTGAFVCRSKAAGAWGGRSLPSAFDPKTFW